MRKLTPLANLRRARTLSQADVSRVLGISQQHLSKIERGLLHPSADIRARLSAILGVSERDLWSQPEHETAGVA